MDTKNISNEEYNYLMDSLDLHSKRVKNIQCPRCRGELLFTIKSSGTFKIFCTNNCGVQLTSRGI